MAEILFVKTSSLGDVIHHMPALTEARRRLPDARLSWVVEEPFAPLVRLHPAVDEVIAVATRRWRRAPHRPETWREIGVALRGLRARRYDHVVDTQGLFRSAMIARTARGRRHGYDAASIKERAGTLLYDSRHAVAPDRHAVDRNRALTALALGYSEEGPADYGLDRARLAEVAARPYGVLLHATARAEKEWPETHWLALSQTLGKSVDLLLPHGGEAERARSEHIAAGSSRASVPDRRPLDAMARLIAGASFVVGVDTGLLHLAAALGVPLVAIFAGSDPGLTGPTGSGPIAVVGRQGQPPSIGDVADAVADVRKRAG